MQFQSALAAAFLSATATGIPSLAFADAAFLQRFKGDWRGSGEIRRDVDSSPRKVSCQVRGTQATANRVSISGTCRAAIIVTRRIGADLTYDPATKRYSGTYSGSIKGPAQISGTQRGDAMVLTITYPVPIYGDRTALMTIRNAGNGRFSMVVTDKVEGRNKETSNIVFAGG